MKAEDQMPTLDAMLLPTPGNIDGMHRLGEREMLN